MNLAGLFRGYQKRKAIRLYLTRMAPLLRNRYGKKHHYSPEQVKENAQEAGLPMDDLCYAFSMYCDQEAFDAYHEMTGEECHYWEMRLEIAEHHFHGNGSFTTDDVVEVASVHSHGGFGHADGHHFGGDGGHSGGHH